MGFKKQVFAEVVEAEKNAPPFSDHFHTRDQTNRHFHCSNAPNLAISVGERIIVYTSASCQQAVDGFTSDAEFWSRPTGHHIVSRTYPQCLIRKRMGLRYIPRQHRVQVLRRVQSNCESRAYPDTDL